MADRLTVQDLQKMKDNKQKIAAAVVYEAQMTILMEKAGADLLSVGDSLGRNFLGHTDPHDFTVDEMIPFCRAVARTAKRAVVNCDLPGATLEGGPQKAVEAAKRLLDVGAQTVKIDTREDMVGLFDSAVAMIKAGIPLYPQIGHADFRQRWSGPEAVKVLTERGKALEDAGALMLDLTGVGPDVYAALSQALKIPVLGGQATNVGDGQINVAYGLVGYTAASLDSGKPSAAQFILDTATKAFADIHAGNF